VPIPPSWSPNIVTGKSYDAEVAEGKALRDAGVQQRRAIPCNQERPDDIDSGGVICIDNLTPCFWQNRPALGGALVVTTHAPCAPDGRFLKAITARAPQSKLGDADVTPRFSRTNPSPSHTQTSSFVSDCFAQECAPTFLSTDLQWRP
jgi:hypothetical protein